MGALLGSFAIYLVPLVGPHAAWLLGEHLYAELTRGIGRSPAWVAADVATALAAQATLYALFRWVLSRKSLLRWLALAASAPLFFVALEWAYLLAIPSHFLIDPDVAPEQTRWTEECVLPDVSLAGVRTAPDLPLERAGRAWISGREGRSFEVLESCDRRGPIDLGVGEVATTEPFVVADGKALFALWNKGRQQAVWWYSRGDRAAPLERPPADPTRSFPILSNDGLWTAWKEYVPGITETPLPERIVIRALEGDREEIVPLPAPGKRSVELLGVNSAARTLTFLEHDYASRANALLTLGFDGEPRGRTLLPASVEPQSTTVLEVGDGWVAWDAYREQGRYRIAWSVAGAAGEAEVPLGRGITAVDAAPTGAYVAVSTTTALNIGGIRDSVFVLSTKDGTEVFRRYLPTYTRSRVAFLGADRFAYDERGGVRILRISRD